MARGSGIDKRALGVAVLTGLVLTGFLLGEQIFGLLSGWPIYVFLVAVILASMYMAYELVAGWNAAESELHPDDPLEEDDSDTEEEDAPPEPDIDAELEDLLEQSGYMGKSSTSHSSEVDDDRRR